MADVELVIKIPKELYNACDGAKNIVGDGSMYDLLIDAIGNGTSLDDVLDKIKIEIEEQVLESLSDGGDDWFVAEKVNECLEIIDKYRKESKDVKR